MLRAVPDLRGERFSTLLDFENASDLVFIATSPELRSGLDRSVAHTGHGSLRLSGARDGLGGVARTFNIKLASLLGNRHFPGKWTLAGGYFYCEKPAQIIVNCDIGGVRVGQNRVTVSPGKWAPVMVDLAGSPQSQPQAPAGPASLSFDIANSDGVIWCDDVLLIDNVQWFVGSEDAPGAWNLCRRGLNYIADAPGKFSIRLATVEATAGGWHLEEANDLRARFSSTGRNKTLTVLPDGRSYWDGNYRPLAAELRAEPLWAQQQTSPAQIEVPETLGRLNRRTAGDANNDGYNEARAAYQIIATGPRLEVNIIPQSAPVLCPMLEISGLPEGKALVTVEGRLIEQTLRLEDGTLLLQIPARIIRATTVNLRVQ